MVSKDVGIDIELDDNERNAETLFQQHLIIQVS